MSEDKPKFVISPDYQLYSLKPEGVYPVPESDWDRVKRMVCEIIPVRSWFQAAAATFFGVFVSALFALVSFSEYKNVPSWALVTTWSGFVVGLVLAVALFLLDQQQRESVSRSAQSVVAEMELLEKGYEKSKQPEVDPPMPPATIKQ